MKKVVFIILSTILIIGLISCEKIEDPDKVLVESYEFYPFGENQIVEAGDYLEEDIGMQIYSGNTNTMINGLHLEFDVIKGDGEVDNFDTVFDQNGLAGVKWKLGYESCEQIVRAKTYKKTGELINQYDIRAYGLLNNVWNEIMEPLHKSVVDLEFDSISQSTYMVSGGHIYKQGDKYYQWIKMETSIESVRTIDFDSNGTIFAGTWYGELYKSTDLGLTWTKCSNPIAGRNYYFEFYITSDNCLWATAWEHGLHYSNDGGLTWSKDLTGIENQEEMLDVFKFGNGDLVSLSRNKLVILRSQDGGKNWAPINTPLYTIKIYVTKNDELIAINQDNGITIYKSTDYGQTYREVLNVSPSWRTSPMEHIFQTFHDICYVNIPGYGIFTTTDFEEFKLHSRHTRIRELFIDHNKVLIAKDWQSASLYYRKDL